MNELSCCWLAFFFIHIVKELLTGNLNNSFHTGEISWKKVGNLDIVQ